MTRRIARTYDSLLQMKDAGAVTASAAAQVAAADKILDLGPAPIDGGYVNGEIVMDVTAIDTTSGDEKYEIEIQLSNSATFASGNVCRSVVKLGDSTVNASSADSVAGRIVTGFTNEFEGTVYRYARLFHRIAGTTPSINYSAYLAKGFPTAHA